MFCCGGGGRGEGREQVEKLGERSDGDDWGVVLEYLRRGFEGDRRCGGLGDRAWGEDGGGRAEEG